MILISATLLFLAVMVLREVRVEPQRQIQTPTFEESLPIGERGEETKLDTNAEFDEEMVEDSSVDTDSGVDNIDTLKNGETIIEETLVDSLFQNN